MRRIAHNLRPRPAGSAETPHDNPYTPHAGARPPELVGRDAQLQSFEVLLDRLRRGHSEQSMLITGLRGVGKTVLLGACEERARRRDWITVEAEITKVQFLTANELEALIAGLHKTVQRQLPITLVGAGVPQLPRLAGEARSYAERPFQFPMIGELGGAEAADALTRPAAPPGVEYEREAVQSIVEFTQGYPYFLQEYGKLVWDVSPESPITLQDVRDSRADVEATLDASFIRVRTDRVTELELRHMRAMAELGAQAQAAKDVAALMDRTSEQLGPTRSRLIEKGLLYTPAHGLAAFTVPQFDRHMRRAHVPDVPPPRRRTTR